MFECCPMKYPFICHETTIYIYLQGLNSQKSLYVLLVILYVKITIPIGQTPFFAVFIA